MIFDLFYHFGTLCIALCVALVSAQLNSTQHTALMNLYDALGVKLSTILFFLIFFLLPRL
jgi:hypothetical protein